MLIHLANVSIRSLFLIALAGAALLVVRKRSSPALRHAVWTAVVLGMLALFAIGETLPRLPLRVLNPPPQQQNTVTQTMTVNEPFPTIESAPVPQPATTTPHRTIDWTARATDLYAIVAAALAIRFLLGMLLVRRLLAKSKPADGFRESDLIGIPVTAGWLQPVIVLPIEWREWNKAKLETVLTHERAHVRRKDGLIVLVAGLNRCLFWFNPLAWWLERRLALLAEQACDEATILTLGGGDDNREEYVNLLLDMAAHIRTPQGRLRNHVLAMASHSQIRRRIEPLLNQRRVFSRGLTTAAFAALIVCGIPMVWATGSIDLAHQAAQLHLDVSRFTIAIPQVPEQHRQLLAQSTPPQPLEALTSFTPVESGNPHDALVVHGTVSFGLPQAKPNRIAQAQPPAAPPPAAEAKFNVASVRPCRDGDTANGRGGRGGGMSTSPGLLRVTCMSVADMIQFAFVANGAPLTNDSIAPLEDNRVRGGPSWIRSDQYTIEAKTNDPAATESPAGLGSPASKKMAGTMLQHLLEDRFQLKLHRETEQKSMYALTVAKGGLKIKPMAEGDCIEDGPPEWPEGGKPPCGWIGINVHGPNRRILAGGVPFRFLATALGDMFLDQPVADETGVEGNFLFRLEYSPDETTRCMGPAKMCQTDPTSQLTPGPSIPDALQDLGLKLTSTKAPHGYIVIDSISRPSEN